MRPDKYKIDDEVENTGPIDVEEIRILTINQERQETLNRKQKKKHELRALEVKNEPINLKRLAHSFQYAFSGLAYVLRSQPNMKIHFIIGTIAIILGFIFHISQGEWLALVIVIGFVIILEFVNTAIESLVDLYTEDFSFLAKSAKDVGAATVLVMAFVSVVVGCIIFLPKFYELFMSLI